MLKTVVRCGIYTRKSTEEGLDQDRLSWADAFLGMSNVVTAKFNPFRELTVNGALQLGTLRSTHYLTGRWR